MQGIKDGLLLSEHAHRVANDMAVAAAALRLANRKVGGDPAIDSAIARLDATARIQRLLCVRPSGTVVDLTTALRTLCAAIALAHPDQGCAVEVSGPRLPVDDGEAVLVTMCVHELVGNALRHAGSRGGHVRVALTDDGSTTTVVVLDRNGARDWRRSGGQGAVIVDQLAARLGGTVYRSVPASGGSVTIAVPSLAAGALTALGVA